MKLLRLSSSGAVAAALALGLTAGSAAAEAPVAREAPPKYPIRMSPEFPAGVCGPLGLLCIVRQPQASCLVQFDLTDEGQPFNICANCVGHPSSEPYIEEVERVVSLWRYAPIWHGEAGKQRTGLQTRVEFVVWGGTLTISYPEDANCPVA